MEDNRTCPHIVACSVCKSFLCQHCIYDCSGCGQEFCQICHTSHLVQCTECTNLLCPEDKVETICCHKIICPSCDVTHMHVESGNATIEVPNVIPPTEVTENITKEII